MDPVAFGMIKGLLFSSGLLVGALVVFQTTKYYFWRKSGICLPGLPCK
jgi:hypothetical protein